MANRIGTLNEKPLHAALKQWYTQPNDLTEASVDGFTVDIVRGDLLIEIQTCNLSAIRRKLTILVEHHPVRLVYPIAQDKWIVRQSKNGKGVLGRKSPKRGTIETIFEELVSVPRLLAHPNFSMDVLLIQEEQVRRYDDACNPQGAFGSWRRRGRATHERRLLQVVGRRLFETPNDMLALVPTTLPEPFTTTDLAQAFGHPLWLAQKMAYCLREMGAIVIVGKRGRGILYIRQPGDS